ncbi:MAG: hypothetical protein WB778_09760 [Thermoplasmata archaeon]|jgi:hypothetical protein
MPTTRRFCRFSESADTAAFSVTQIPKDGLCISSFVILRSQENPEAVLMGHMNPEAPWDDLGALDPARIEAHRSGWMLPSSHLIFYESPDESAQRILREQLGLPRQTLAPPIVLSDTYAPRRHPGATQHWDLGFLYQGSIPSRPVPHAPAWKELAFVDTRSVHRADIARSHEDVLGLVGLPISD